MYVLGISCYYHDSAAALLRDGRVVAAVGEERLTRIKSDDSFPDNAIRWCLDREGITAQQLDHVAFYEKPVLKLERLLDNYVAFAPRGLRSFVDVIPRWIHERLWVKDRILKRLDGYRGEVLFPEHHVSHAAHSFFTSPFEEAAVLTVDGVGEWSTTSLGTASGTAIEMTHDIKWPHSLGLLYSAFTYFLGFRVNDGEYKVMGAASYGRPAYADLILDRLVDVKDDGSMHLNMKYFEFAHGRVMTGQKFEDLFGVPSPRKSGFKLEREHFDIAASAQLVLEEILLKMAAHLHGTTGMKNLCIGGGVGLNGVANSRLLRDGPFERIHVPPSPGDAGSAAGCAQYLYFSHLGNPRVTYADESRRIRENVYVGPAFSDGDIRAAAESADAGISVKRMETPDLLRTTAQLISEGKVVGWYQGESEWGPRALGNRSILADPRDAGMKDILNEKIKHREGFRPFAPSVLSEHAGEYFEIGIPSPYMLFVSRVRKPESIPAATHVDGTSRLQTVSAESNPIYHALISEFYRITGVPVLVNTSMNVAGEPMVNTPGEAVAMLYKTEMDCLVMGNYLLISGGTGRDGGNGGGGGGMRQEGAGGNGGNGGNGDTEIAGGKQ